MKYFSKRLVYLMISLCLLPSAMSMAAFAAEDSITSIDIHISLYEDGSAYISEIWNVNNVYSGTEYYIPISNAEHITISNLSVVDKSGNVFTYMEDWDSSASFEEKKYRCGILQTTDGYELCWGISQYGDKSYTISYDMTGLVGSYTDKDGFYHQFINNELSSPPETVYLSIAMDGMSFSADNAEIYAIGFEGEI